MSIGSDCAFGGLGFTSVVDYGQYQYTYPNFTYPYPYFINAPLPVPCPTCGTCPTCGAKKDGK